MSDPIVLTAEDFVDADFIMVRPRLVKKFGGDVPAVLMIARIQFRCQVQPVAEDGLRWWKAKYSDLSEETGLSPDQAKRVIEKLVEKKIVLAKIDNESAWDRTKSYRVDVRSVHLAIPPDASGESARSNRAESPDLLSTEEALKNLRTNGQSPAPAEPDSFPGWWKLYPKKVGKDAGEKAYRRALKKATADELLDGLRRYVDWLGPDPNPRYIAHPSTWLNEGRWSDELQANKPEASGAYVERNGVMLTRKNAEALDMLQKMRQQTPQQLAIDPGARARELEGAPW